MLLQQRHREILKLLQTQSSVIVGELARKFDVSEETVRRDLAKLERGGKLVRSHGGALPPENTTERPYQEREAQNAQAKKVIAKKAIELIKPGERVMLDGSSTAYFLSTELNDIEISVVTNSVRVADELSNKNITQLIMLGGDVSMSSMSCAGEATLRALLDYRVDKLFFSCAGVDNEAGLTDANESQAILRRAMMERATELILLADKSKFGLKMLYRICAKNEVSRIISDD